MCLLTRLWKCHRRSVAAISLQVVHGDSYVHVDLLHVWEAFCSLRRSRLIRPDSGKSGVDDIVGALEYSSADLDVLIVEGASEER
jgi:hypothetical protein